MKLSEFTSGIIDGRLLGADVEISSITDDSRKVVEGTCFVALRGHLADGHKYIQQAIDSGAAALVLEDETLVKSFPAFVVKDSKKIVGQLASAFYGFPSKAMKVCGITGTNGKTSCTYLLESMFNKAGFKVGVIGTINYRYGDKIYPALTTTPGAIEMQDHLAKMRDAGVSHVFMEVSSHALDQYRADGTLFDYAQFTNLTRDHLDYHDGMDDYLKAKQRLFDPLLEQSEKNEKAAIINIDDEYAEKVLASYSGRVIRTALEDRRADIYAESLETSLDGNRMLLNVFGKQYQCASPLTGVHNAKNIIQAVAVGLSAGLSATDALEGVSSLKAIPGRVEKVEDKNRRHVFVDYSHTPDALQNTLSSLKKLKEGRLFVVFGCGGDRDRGKRPLMGQVAAQFADVVVVTSDNPRGEEPAFIISEIEPGVIKAGMQKAASDLACEINNGEYQVIENRAEAIRFVCQAAKAEDVILIAGKGHEDYQIIKGVKYHFDDREEAAKALKSEAGGSND